jgi:hypothetical protein
MKHLKQVVELILEGIGLGVVIVSVGSTLGLWHMVFAVGRHAIDCTR